MHHGLPLTTQSMPEVKQLLGPAGDKVQLLGIDANPDATSVADVLSYWRAHAWSTSGTS